MNIHTKLLIAAEEGNLDEVKYYLTSMSDITELNSDKCKDNGYSALALAVKNGHREVAKVLMWADADVNATNNAQQSVLFIACWANRVDIAKDLIDRGADLDL